MPHSNTAARPAHASNPSQHDNKSDAPKREPRHHVNDGHAAPKKTNSTVETSGSFADYDLPPAVLAALTNAGFTSPTPIQKDTLELALAGRDILGSAQTGTGKTGAFTVPLLTKLINDAYATALILLPTRELAAQVAQVVRDLNPDPRGIKTALLIGGDSMSKQLQQLRQRPRVIIGTPGRVNDHLTRGTLSLETAQILVLDETDRMLDMGFGVQLNTIIPHMPDSRQTLMFSATMPAAIAKLSAKYLKNPARISMGATHNVAAKIKQETIETTEGDKYNLLSEQLEKRSGSVIIFVKTRAGADRLALKLSKADHTAAAIHGDLQQRQRTRVINAFREKEYRILVATDVAARGLDIPHIEHVINYDLPQVPEDYIHRIGRTARAGAEGAAVSLVTPTDRNNWRAISRLLGTGESDTDGQGFKRGGGGQPRRGQGSRPAPRSGGGANHRGQRDGARNYGDRPARAERSEVSSDRVERPARPARDYSPSADRSGKYKADQRPVSQSRSEYKTSRTSSDSRGDTSAAPKAYAPRTDARPVAKSEGRAFSDRPAKPAGKSDWKPSGGKPAFGDKARKPAGKFGAGRPGGGKPSGPFKGPRNDRKATIR